jgi:hypothetical protein
MVKICDGSKFFVVLLQKKLVTLTAKIKCSTIASSKYGVYRISVTLCSFKNKKFWEELICLLSLHKAFI